MIFKVFLTFDTLKDTSKTVPLKTVLRSVLFQVTLYTWITFILILLSPALCLPRRFSFRIFRLLTRHAVFLMKHILKIRCQFKNVSFLQDLLRKEGPFIIACKHQSGFETVVFSLFLDDFTIVSKRGMRFVPLIGWFMSHMHFIFLNRKNGKQAFITLLQQGKEAVLQGRPLLIFPEGSRSEFGKVGKYHSGVALLYKHLRVPIVPVALNTGSVWQRKSLIKFPGTLTIQVLPPIQPGLDTDQVLQKLEQEVEKTCQELGDGRV